MIAAIRGNVANLPMHAHVDPQVPAPQHRGTAKEDGDVAHEDQERRPEREDAGDRERR